MPPESWSGNWLRDVLEPDEPRAPRRARARRSRFRHALHLEAERDVVDHAPVREQAEVLEDHRDRVPAQLAQLGSRSRAITSRPSISIAPAVGSISRISVRTSVDLPEPESPMTTKTSPGQTSSETSLTATTLPVFARSSAAREVDVLGADEALGVAARRPSRSPTRG